MSLRSKASEIVFCLQLGYNRFPQGQDAAIGGVAGEILFNGLDRCLLNGRKGFKVNCANAERDQVCLFNVKIFANARWLNVLNTGRQWLHNALILVRYSVKLVFNFSDTDFID